MSASKETVPGPLTGKNVVVLEGIRIPAMPFFGGPRPDSGKGAHDFREQIASCSLSDLCRFLEILLSRKKEIQNIDRYVDALREELRLLQDLYARLRDANGVNFQPLKQRIEGIIFDARCALLDKFGTALLDDNVFNNPKMLRSVLIQDSGWADFYCQVDRILAQARQWIGYVEEVDFRIQVIVKFFFEFNPTPEA